MSETSELCPLERRPHSPTRVKLFRRRSSPHGNVRGTLLAVVCPSPHPFPQQEKGMLQSKATSDAIVAVRPLLSALGRFFRCTLAGCGLGHHVDNDIVGHHRRGGIAERTGISIGPQRRGGQRIRCVDRVSSPYRVILVSLERLAAVGAG